MYNGEKIERSNALGWRPEGRRRPDNGPFPGQKTSARPHIRDEYSRISDEWIS